MMLDFRTGLQQHLRALKIEERKALGLQLHKEYTGLLKDARRLGLDVRGLKLPELRETVASEIQMRHNKVG